MAFQQGLSGLNTAGRNLDVIGNNIANANTVGFKASRTEFADLYATSLYGAGSNAVGIGTQVAAVAQQFTQGDVSITSNPMDLAINGPGFFRLSSQGTVEFSRNGQFRLDRDGYIVNAGGARLTGYQATPTGSIAVGVPTDLRLVTADVAPRATDAAAATVNLDAQAAAVGTTPFDPNNPATYGGATSMSVFDSQGGEHTLALYFRKTAANTWDVIARANGGTVGTTGTLAFDTTGRLNVAGSTTPFSVPVPVGAGAGGTLNVPVDLSAVTQFGSPFAVSRVSQNGYTTGRLTGFSIGGDGTIQARYSNGQAVAQGQVALANFANAQGLAPLGGNRWAETADSGQPLVAAPGAGNLGVLQSGAVEQSNVDLTGELVSMITAQRSYQANAQTIRTQDQVLQTIVNLR